MKITDIKQQVKRQGRYSIFVDEKYSFSLSESELMTSGIRNGREYSPAELDELQDRAVLDKAYMRSLDLIARRARSEWEIRDYLKRKDYDEEVVEVTLNKLSKAGYVDDEKFARAWVDNRRLLKATSKQRLTQELRQKRVSDEIIKQVLEADETDERDVLRELIAKKRSQTKYQDNIKLMQYLMRQGFSYGDIKVAMSNDD